MCESRALRCHTLYANLCFSNIGYSVGVSEQARAKFEGAHCEPVALQRAGFDLTVPFVASESGRLQLKDKQAAHISRSKTVHLWLFVSFLVGTLLVTSVSGDPLIPLSMVPRAAFLLGGWYESYIRLEKPTSFTKIANGMARVGVAFFLGTLAWWIYFVLFD